MFHPLLLAGVTLMGLPVLLHLLMRQEPKRIVFPAFRLLQQKSRINQRKLRLRHFLLLLLRMLLILLMALTLFQPLVLSDRLNLKGEQPVAAVIVLDTSPSMGYIVAEREFLDEIRQKQLQLLGEVPKGPWTLFDEARARVLELIDQLPENSKVVLVETGDPVQIQRWPSIEDVRRRVRDLKKPSFSGASLSEALPRALRLLSRVDKEQGENLPPLPKLLVLLSDRTRDCWGQVPADEIQKALQEVPPPLAKPIFVDVGLDKTFNAGIVAAQVKPELVPAQQPVKISVLLLAKGKELTTTLACRVDGKAEVERKPVQLADGEAQGVEFTLTNLAPGPHQVELLLESSDPLPFDNVRYLSFRVRLPRDVLIIADEPDEALLWSLALEKGRQFRVRTVTPPQAMQQPASEWNRVEAICLFGVAGPSAELWKRLDDFVRSGGQLLVMPLDDNLKLFTYNDNPTAQGLMPGTLRGLVRVDEKAPPIGWNMNALDFEHSLLKPFREWLLQGNIDFIRFPPTVVRYWDVVAHPKAKIVTQYTDPQQRPALLERKVGSGRVMLFTTGMDGRRDELDRPYWNDYLATSFYFVLANQVLESATGEQDNTVFNFAAGLPVTLKVPKEESALPANLILQGPGISGDDAILKRDPPKTGKADAPTSNRVEIPRRLTAQAGNFTLSRKEPPWQEAFSLNAPGGESVLDRAAVEPIQASLGDDAIFPLTRQLRVKDLLEARFTAPVELFPYLLLLLLLLFTLEGLLANKFYREPTATGRAGA